MPENAVIRVEKPLFFLLYAAFEGGNEGFLLQKEADGCGR